MQNTASGNGSFKTLGTAFAIASIVLAVIVVVDFNSSSGYFDATYLLQYSIAPILFLCFVHVMGDDKRKVWGQHNVCGILLYVWFGIWSIFGVIRLLQWLQYIDQLTNLGVLIVANEACFTTTGILGGLYYHNFKKANELMGGQPLMMA